MYYNIYVPCAHLRWHKGGTRVAQGGQSGARVRAHPGNSRLDGGARVGEGR